MHVFAFSNGMEIQNNERQLKENWYLFDIKGELVCQILLGSVWINVWSVDKSDSSGGAQDSPEGGFLYIKLFCIGLKSVCNSFRKRTQSIIYRQILVRPCVNDVAVTVPHR